MPELLQASARSSDDSVMLGSYEDQQRFLAEQ